MKKLSNLECQLAQLQELCIRTLVILDDEDFFSTSATKNSNYVSLKRDLEKASKGKEFKLFVDLMTQLPKEEFSDIGLVALKDKMRKIK